ncbi:hypothetical protein O181_007463 [Austropuccinia psidii MF-1]|uniref:Secreted protein n=1 Tax=Austropuccinia psidii MF-1 TaxID=1389203 RepID=A0A9Q3BM84_9BASI|nr:hypothetical protein [Austropuccinia psidii MF-1]
MFKSHFLTVHFLFSFIRTVFATETQICDTEFLPVRGERTPKSVWCVNKSKIRFKCLKNTCQAPKGSLYWAFYFANCTFEPASWLNMPFTWPTSFDTYPPNNIKVYTGQYSAERHGVRYNITFPFHCVWNGENDHNAIRPKCGSCVPDKKQPPQ